MPRVTLKGFQTIKDNIVYFLANFSNIFHIKIKAKRVLIKYGVLLQFSGSFGHRLYRKYNTNRDCEYAP